MNNLRSIYFNLKYRLEGSFREARREGVAGTQCFLLGKKYDLGRPLEREQYDREFESLLWLSYRDGIEEVGSDTGWGCMVRVGQMVLANSIRTLLLKLHGGRIPKESQLNLILKFLEDEGNGWLGPYSLKVIIQEATSRLGYRSGQWMTSLNISKCLEAVFNKSPFKGLDGLFVQSFNQILFKNRVLQLMTGRADCACGKGGKFCGGCVEGSKGKQLLLLISTILSVDNIGEEKYPLIKALMKVPSFAGIIGGKGKEALFIVGLEDDALLYLDPHYAKTQLHRHDCQKLLEDYRCKDRRRMSLKELRPSITVGYLVQELGELAVLFGSLEEHTRSEHAFVFIEEEASLDLRLKYSDTPRRLEQSIEKSVYQKERLEIETKQNTSQYEIID